MEPSEVAPSPAAEEKTSFVELTEGKATLIYDGDEEVFYNQVQEFNRDMSTLVIGCFSAMLRDEKSAKEQKRQAKIAASINQEIVPSRPPWKWEGLNILEGLSATGLRSIRFYKEIKAYPAGAVGTPAEPTLDPTASSNPLDPSFRNPDVKSIVINDLDSRAVATIQRNVKFNNISPEICVPNEGDANIVMLSRKKNQLFDVVDLDPYGSAAPFLTAAVQSLVDGGLLCITSTDKAVLCGNKVETCFSKYGVMPVKAPYHHEMATRILLSAIQRQASIYSRYIVPLFSMSVDFYVRVYVRIYTSANLVKGIGASYSRLRQCIQCDSFALDPLGKKSMKGTNVRCTPSLSSEDHHCDQCGSAFKVGGPMWSEPLHDRQFLGTCLEALRSVHKGLGTFQRMEGVLSVAQAELESPFYYCLPSLCSRIRLSTPKVKRFRSALLNAGYKVSQTHCEPTGTKTDAPNNVVWDIIRGMAKENPPNKSRITAFAAKILEKKVEVEANFTPHGDANPLRDVVAFPTNPTKNWGPKSRAGKRKRDVLDLKEGDNFEYAKSKANQNKRMKTKVCNRFQQGNCLYGERCKYQHVSGETVTIPAVDPPATAAAVTVTTQPAVADATST